MRTKSCSSRWPGKWCGRGVNDIREAGRNTQGVKLIDLDANDKLTAIAPVISEEKDEEEPPAAEGTAPETPETPVA